MAAPATVDEFLDLLRKSNVTDEKRLEAFLAKLRPNLPKEPAKLAMVLIQGAILTNFQAENILAGKWRRFSIGKYKVLERLGSGGFAQVYLCEHSMMRRRVAVKVLPVAKTKGSSALERFFREARAAADLDHPNIVHAYDIDQDGDLHFIVMEYVDGPNLQEIVKRTGPLSVPRACNYIAQAAHALHHAFEKGMVHRDIKPGNFLVDRSGVVKLLDLGLALREGGAENSQLTKMHDDGALGTADYISPEQAMDSHGVDIRTDIYSLGVTFYFLLMGRPPYEGLPIADKLLAHQMKEPRPIREVRNDVPDEVVAIIAKMMAKRADQRYAVPGDIVDALAPFTQEEVPLPSEQEFLALSPLASGQVGDAESKPNSGAAAARSPYATSGPRTPMGGGAARPSAPQVAPAVAVAAPTDMTESSRWEPFSTDTDNPLAKGDTAPSSRPSSKTPNGNRPDGKRRLIFAILILGFIVIPILLTVVIGLSIWLIFPSKEPKDNNNGPRRFIVSKDPNRKNAHPSIRSALRDAEFDSVIELWDDVIIENVVFDGSQGARTNITLQAAPGKEVIWRGRGNDPAQPILRVVKTRDFKLKGKGILFDGTLSKDVSVNNLLMITSDCSGMVIEDLQMKSFTNSAILVMNATGSADKPIRLDRLWTITQPPEQPRAAIYFDANPKVTPPLNDHIEIRNCDFRGIEPGDAIQFNKKLPVLGDDVHWPGK